MTLRLRLVLGLVVLTTAGLALFGVSTYTVYAHLQYQRLDDQLQASVPFVIRPLRALSSGDVAAEPGPDRPVHGSRPPPGPVSIYAEQRGSDGRLVNRVRLATSSTPKLPTVLRGTAHGRFFTTGSVTGTGDWRVYVVSGPGPSNTTVVAIPTGEVIDALHRLVLVEVGGALVLLGLLSTGAWLILRRGLRPLEHMATTAGSIADGDLTQRVEPAGGASEVGQLGLALNTMLDEIEAAFSERDATEQRLRQFLADASHELRTPLTSIQGFAELFRIGDTEHTDLPTILRRIEEESARMKVLVEDLLLLARLDETRAPQRGPVDLTVLAADACSDAAAGAPDRRITLDAPQPVVVAGDEAHLRQAIANLVANAVKHTPTGTPVEVATALVDGGAVVTVRDHGTGLEDDALAHAFDRFWQADRARSGAGAGLGLAIVAGIASEHAGTASAANAPDGGAVFTLRLPLSP